MEDHYRSGSAKLVAPALDGVRQGDPSAVEFLYQHYDFLHEETKRDVFDAIRERLRSTGDRALATRLQLRGHADLAVDYPLLSMAIRRRAGCALRAAANELIRPKFGDINATSRAAEFIRDIVADLPLTAFLGAKLRVLLAKRRRLDRRPRRI